MERAIRYIRDAFFAGRTFTDVVDLNAQADAWVLGPAGERRCPEDETLTVSDAFAQEQARLLALPGDAFPTDEIKAVSAGKTPYVRFDLNDYSIPHTCVARTLALMQDLTPGDFATVKRQCLLLGEELTPDDWIMQLELEMKAKQRPGTGQDRSVQV